MKFALTRDLTGVVDKEKSGDSDGSRVHKTSATEQSGHPSLTLVLLIIAVPSLRPTVGKVYDQHQLYKDEQEASDHAKIHPSLAE